MIKTVIENFGKGAVSMTQDELIQDFVGIENEEELQEKYDELRQEVQKFVFEGNVEGFDYENGKVETVKIEKTNQSSGFNVQNYEVTLTLEDGSIKKLDYYKRLNTRCLNTSLEPIKEGEFEITNNYEIKQKEKEKENIKIDESNESKEKNTEIKYYEVEGYDELKSFSIKNNFEFFDDNGKKIEVETTKYRSSTLYKSTDGSLNYNFSKDFRGDLYIIEKKSRESYPVKNTYTSSKFEENVKEGVEELKETLTKKEDIPNEQEETKTKIESKLKLTEEINGFINGKKVIVNKTTNNEFIVSIDGKELTFVYVEFSDTEIEIKNKETKQKNIIINLKDNTFDGDKITSENIENIERNILIEGIFSPSEGKNIKAKIETVNKGKTTNYIVTLNGKEYKAIKNKVPSFPKIQSNKNFDNIKNINIEELGITNTILTITELNNVKVIIKEKKGTKGKKYFIKTGTGEFEIK